MYSHKKINLDKLSDLICKLYNHISDFIISKYEKWSNCVCVWFENGQTLFISYRLFNKAYKYVYSKQVSNFSSDIEKGKEFLYKIETEPELVEHYCRTLEWSKVNLRYYKQQILKAGYSEYTTLLIIDYLWKLIISGKIKFIASLE